MDAVEEYNAARHIFDVKAFRRYSLRLLAGPSITLAAELLLLSLSSRLVQPDLLLLFLRIALPALGFAATISSFLKMFYTLRKSDVFTSPGYVLYRKRRFFSSQSEGVCFIVYHITNAKSVEGNEKDPVTVKGDIDAAYVMRDGKTIHSVKKHRKVLIPPCFLDMGIIRDTLSAMEK